MRRFIALFACGLFIVAASLAQAAEVAIYISPSGDSKASGNDEGKALDSLQVAIERVLAQKGPDITARRILVLPGHYVGQFAVIEDLSDGIPLVIAAAKGGRPVFDGNGEGRTWLVLKSSTGKPTRVTIEGLEVTNYVTAISLNGDRDSERASNSENIVRGNVFRKIGQIAYPSGNPSTAVIRLVNSKHNTIIQNHFVDIRNITRCSKLHAIYMAHYSSNNLIEHNTFERGCGATLKTRDASNDNVIRNNRFIEQRDSLLVDSFCDKNVRGEDCTKKTNECPSWGNTFEANTAERMGPRARKAPIAILGPNNPTGCPLPRTKERLNAAQNRL
ncbi:MAG: right-handed parallel beta-helix repeat-containing protein [Burkholderiaceae bacterium]|nr:right-handed parallel beta-helix repeat-containing protein [Burkholderiaceae bacterium]